MMKVYRLECRTGCTCCADDNHYRGFYRTHEEAKARMDRFYRGIDNPLASQYAKFGHYAIEQCHAEEIAHNRIIINDRVYSLTFVSVNLEDGSITKGTEEPMYV